MTRKVEQIQPRLDLHAVPDLTLTDDIRAELVRRTGQDMKPDDPAWVLVVLNQILLPRLSSDIEITLRNACEEIAMQMTEMRKEALRITVADMTLIAGQARESLKLDLTEASARAANIVKGIESALNMSRAFWVGMGVLACGLLGFGVWIGANLGK